MDGKTVGTNAPAIDAEESGESWGSFALFVLKLALVVLIFRSFVFSPFSIPSQSMQPSLWNGDYLLAAKWPYGISKYSLPFEAPLISGRVFAGQPERGDVVIFKHPIDGTDYIKRVIGLPGDSFAMRNGLVVLNGEALPQTRLDDIVIPVSPNSGCSRDSALETTADGSEVCRYTRFRETLPSGKSYDVIDLEPNFVDTTAPRIVPEGRVLVLGDNRDASYDSRYPAEPDKGVGLVPQEKLVGRASLIMWSTDGSSEWLKPWTWISGARWDRIGDSL